MKLKISLPIFLGLIVLVVGGILLLKGKGSSAPEQTSQSTSQTQVSNDSSPDSSVSVQQDNNQLEPSGKLVDGVREVEVTAKQWEFIPNPIVVNEGEKVRLKIKSIDVTHGFALPDFGVNEVLNPGQEVTVEFVANKKGTFSFFCSVPCGFGHSGMRGRLVVK